MHNRRVMMEERLESDKDRKDLDLWIWPANNPFVTWNKKAQDGIRKAKSQPRAASELCKAPRPSCVSSIVVWSATRQDEVRRGRQGGARRTGRALEASVVAEGVTPSEIKQT